MPISRILSYDGHDFYLDDFDWFQDQLETELQSRLESITLTGGVASGLDCTPVADAVDVSAGKAFDGDRGLINLASLTQVAVAPADVGKFVVIENVATTTLSDAHPLTAVAAFRRTEQVATLSVVASPTSAQVKLAEITAASAGNPPTLDTDPPARTLLTLGVSVQGGSVNNPFVTVANDGSGDFTDLQSAINSLPSGGGMIFVKAGAYTVATTITLNKSNVKITGAGPFTRFDVDGSAISEGLVVDGSGVGGISGIKIQDIAFDWIGGDPGAGQNNAALKVLDAVDVSIRGVTFSETLGTVTDSIGIWLAQGCNAVRIHRCEVAGPVIGIQGEPTSLCDRVIISDCTMGRTPATRVTRGIYGKTLCDDWVVQGCTITGSGASATGIEWDGSSDWAVTGNFIGNCNTGVKVGASAAAAGGTVNGNSITGNTSHGVNLLSNSSYIAVTGNNLLSNPTKVGDTGTGNVSANNV